MMYPQGVTVLEKEVIRTIAIIVKGESPAASLRIIGQMMMIPPPVNSHAVTTVWIQEVCAGIRKESGPHKMIPNIVGNQRSRGISVYLTLLGSLYYVVVLVTVRDNRRY